MTNKRTHKLAHLLGLPLLFESETASFALSVDF